MPVPTFQQKLPDINHALNSRIYHNIHECNMHNKTRVNHAQHNMCETCTTHLSTKKATPPSRRKVINITNLSNAHTSSHTKFCVERIEKSPVYKLHHHGCY